MRHGVLRLHHVDHVQVGKNAIQAYKEVRPSERVLLLS